MTDQSAAPLPPSAPTPPPLPSQRQRRHLWMWITGAVVALVILAAAIIIPTTISRNQAAAEKQAAQAAEAARLDAFRIALAGCGIPTGSDVNIEILDGGESVDLQRVTKYDGISFNSMTCFLDKLAAPASIEAEIGQTRALDGRQSDKWDGYAIEWSYHPDDGASLIIKHDD